MWFPSEMNMHGRASEISAYLSELDACTLRWWMLSASLSQLGLQATGLPRGRAEIGFWSIDYLDTPMTMHDVRMRAATADQIQVLRDRSKREHGWIQLIKGGVLAIECTAGLYFVCASTMGFRWIDTPDTASLEQLLSSLPPSDRELMERCK